MSLFNLPRQRLIVKQILKNASITNNQIDILKGHSYKIAVEQKRIYLELGENIRRFRKEASYTQVRLSKDAGISRASLANIEAGRQQVLVHHLYTIAHALQLDSPDQLLPTAPSREYQEVLSSSIPVSGEELTDSQRSEVIHLISRNSK